MTGENTPREGEQSSPSEAAATTSDAAAETAAPPEKSPVFGKWLWAIPPVLTVLLAFGVATWGAGFGAAAIAALGAWIVWAIAREAGARRAPAFAVAWGVTAGILLWLLCTQQSVHVFGSPTPVAVSRSVTPIPTQTATAITCNARIERSTMDSEVVSVTGTISRMPDAARATTVATSDGHVLATEDSYADSRGVATIRLSFASSSGETLQVRTEVRVGAQIVQSCGW